MNGRLSRNPIMKQQGKNNRAQAGVSVQRHETTGAALRPPISKTTDGTQMRSGKDCRDHGYPVLGRRQIHRDLYRY